MAAAYAMGRRVVEPEWLDTLPTHDPRARRSRDDLVRVNALMGNARIVAHALRGLPLATVAEIGAGSGRFLYAVARKLPRAAVRATLLDRHDCADRAALARFAARGWRAECVRADAFDWLRDPGPRCDAIVANLFLHHFERERLAMLLDGIARRTDCFVACEPRRSALALGGARLLGLAGCNDVTRHDAVVSVRAGFHDGELGALWPDDGRWRVEESARAPFSHCFVARRSR